MLEVLAQARPSVVYLASDGGRNESEHKLVCEIRQSVIDAIDWECHVNIKFNDTNLGCKYAVHKAIQWFFSNEAEGIVLEDDCLPSVPFFAYAEMMLEMYRNTLKVGSIGARNEVSKFDVLEAEFTSKFFCWGWASWADRIKNIDVEFGYTHSSVQNLLPGTTFKEACHIKGMHSLMTSRQVSSWAYSYDFAFRAQGSVHLVPPVNYVRNIALGRGTHESRRPAAPDVASVDRLVWFDVDKEPVVNRDFLDAYLNEKYGLIKLLLFPWISHYKRFKQMIKKTR